MKQERKEYLREYMRQWRKKNPEKTKEIQMRYWLNRAKKEKEEEGKT